jgi:hypothetical protein
LGLSFSWTGHESECNNLTHLSHQANSGDWQQTLTIHPNSNRGTENNNQNNFDANGNLLHLTYQVFFWCTWIDF